MHKVPDQMCYIWISYVYAYACAGGRNWKPTLQRKQTNQQNQKKNPDHSHHCNLENKGELFSDARFTMHLKETLCCCRGAFFEILGFFEKHITPMHWQLLFTCLITSMFVDYCHCVMLLFGFCCCFEEHVAPAIVYLQCTIGSIAVVSCCALHHHSGCFIELQSWPFSPLQSRG